MLHGVRFVVTFTHLLILVLGTATSQRTDTLHIRFIGNAAFELSDGTTTLGTDLPYQSGAFGYMTYDVTGVSPPGDVVSVITHRHADHFEASLFERRNWRIIGPREVTTRLPPDRVLAAARRTTIGPFVVTPYPTPHSDTEHYSYLIEWHGRRLYFTGDTEDPAHLLSVEKLDIAFVTPWLLCEIARRGASVPARQVILHHQFPDGRSRVCGTPRRMTQGERISVPAIRR